MTPRALEVLVVLGVLGCGPAAAGAGGRAAMDRIVSLAPSVTELLFAAGAGEQVVGVTHWCRWPPEATTRPSIGGLEIDLEQVLALRPDAVFSASLTPRGNDEIRHLKLPLHLVDVLSLGALTERLRWLGATTGHSACAARAADALEQRIAAVAARVAGRARPSVFFEAGGTPLLTAGPGSFLHDLLQVAGARNAMADLQQPWCRVAWEQVLARDPELILVAHEEQGLEQRAGWAALRAVRTGRVHRVPKDSFFFATPRLVDGLELTARHCHGR